MIFRFFQPSGILAPYIKLYWYLEIGAHEKLLQPQRVVPNGYVELTFHFSDRLKNIEGGATKMQPGVGLCGQKTSYFDVLPSGKTEMLSVQFYPHSATLFFDFPIHEIANLSISLDDALGSDARHLEEQLHDLSTIEERLAHIQGFLAGQLMKRQKFYQWKRIRHNIRQIDMTRGMLTINNLANAACLSRKQHEREFKKMVGLSPKQYLKVIRFQHTLFAHQQFPEESLTELAHRCGYFDQAHMINDFKQLSGLTTGQYFTECDTPYSDYF